MPNPKIIMLVLLIVSLYLSRYRLFLRIIFVAGSIGSAGWLVYAGANADYLLALIAIVFLVSTVYLFVNSFSEKEKKNKKNLNDILMSYTENSQETDKEIKSSDIDGIL